MALLGRTIAGMPVACSLINEEFDRRGSFFQKTISRFNRFQDSTVFKIQPFSRFNRFRDSTESRVSQFQNQTGIMSRNPTQSIKKILCPVDFEDQIEAANRFASMLAQTYEANICYLYCAVPDVVFGKREFDELKKEEEEDLQKLQVIKPKHRGIQVEYDVKFGSPAECIVEYASAYEFDLIVLGTHGRKGIGRMFMGSVAEDVIRNADCPVVAIKSDAYVPSPVS